MPDEATDWVIALIDRAEGTLERKGDFAPFVRPILDHLRGNAPLLREWGADQLADAVRAYPKGLEVFDDTILAQLDSAAINDAMLSQAQQVGLLADIRDRRRAWIAEFFRIVQLFAVHILIGGLRQAK